jgi:hypothetical protein
MRTSIDIPDATYRDLKVKAAREGVSVRLVVLRGIERELEGEEEKPVRRLELPLIHSTRPGTLELNNEQVDELTAFS